jgi:hypothetical protein
MEMPLPQGPAVTTGYMILGFIVIIGLIVGLIVSMAIRRRNLKRDLELLDDLNQRAKD